MEIVSFLHVSVGLTYISIIMFRYKDYGLHSSRIYLRIIYSDLLLFPVKL